MILGRFAVARTMINTPVIGLVGRAQRGQPAATLHSVDCAIVCPPGRNDDQGTDGPLRADYSSGELTWPVATSSCHSQTRNRKLYLLQV